MARSPLAICLMFIIVASSTLYEAQGHFLLNDYLKKFPDTSSEFKPFAFKGMLSFVDGLESLCPSKGEYKEFFTQLKAFMSFINSASGSSSEFNSQLKAQSVGLFKAISTLSGKAGSSGDTSKLIDSLTSMGKTLAGYKRTGSQTITSEQREMLTKSMVKWAKGIGDFVKTVGEKSGSCNIDLSSLGLGDGSSSKDGSSGGSESGTPSSDTGSPLAETSTENESAGGPSGSTSDMSTEGTSTMDGGTTAGSTSGGGSTDSSAAGESSMNGGGSYSDTTGGSSMESPVGSPSGSSGSSDQAGGASADGPSGSVSTEASAKPC